MSAQLLSGTAIAKQMEQELAEEVKRLPTAPRLSVLYFMGGNHLSSHRYWSAQRAAASRLGINVGRSQSLVGTTARQDEVEKIIKDWNSHPDVDAIFVHQPLPPRIDAQRISALIDPGKDVEGIHPQNSARRFFAKARIGSCTALAVMRLIEETGVTLAGKEAVIIGHSEIVGRPVGMLLLDALATTTICHIGTDRAHQLKNHVERADILVAAMGKPEFIKGAWIKSRAIVIDVGVNVVNKRVVGDVEFEQAKERASFITPVPGGVGPVTVMMVMKNTIEACKLQQAHASRGSA